MKAALSCPHPSLLPGREKGPEEDYFLRKTGAGPPLVTEDVLDVGKAGF
jgi:hypothetical protein